MSMYIYIYICIEIGIAYYASASAQRAFQSSTLFSVSCYRHVAYTHMLCYVTEQRCCSLRLLWGSRAGLMVPMGPPMFVKYVYL